VTAEKPSTTATDSDEAASTAALLGRLLRDHVRPHAGRIGLAALMMAAVAGATAATAWLLEPAIDKVFIEQSDRMLILVPLGILAIAIIKAGAEYGQNVLMSHVGQRIIADTQVSMFDHLIHADLSWLHDTHSGTLISSFLYDVTLLRDAVSRAITAIAKDTLSVIFLIGVMFYQDAKLALITAFVFPVAGIAMRKIGRRMRKASKGAQEETGQLSLALTESFQGSRLVKAYGMEDWETARAATLVERRLTHLMKALRTRAAASPITEAVGGIAVGAAIFYGGLEARDGTMTVGAFMSFIGAMLMTYRPLKSLANTNAALQEGLAAAQRVFHLMDVAPEIVDRPAATELVPRGGTIDFENVGFAYVDGTTAIQGISFAVTAGSKIALVGASGAGKSTVLNLVPRFYDVSEGRVLIDGQDVRDVMLASLRASVGLVSQEVALFDTTVRANIAYGRPDADEPEIVAAAEAAAADTFIRALPQGYDTIVGEAGVKLSGGQRQRIAIARAMLKNAPILLLDEATSALDSESERQVQAALQRLMEGRTTVIVAHRLSTVMDADEIYVMDAGRIVERGTHQELLARGDVYAKLYALQATEQPAAMAAD
jgi:ATP-binding cassette, subfamily B, bacterial MsbA